MKEQGYRWVILSLASLTHTLCVALPVMCLPVLFKEISEDLHLSLVQMGTIWGAGFLPGIIMGTVGGALGDRFGTRQVLRGFCVLAGIGCALRGISDTFWSLGATNLVYGCLFPAIPTNVHKTCGIWFSKGQLGLANGTVSMGMAMGFMVTSMISATFLSPLLGGWRHVLFFYGGISVLVGVFWHFARPAPSQASQRVPFRQAITHVLPIRNVWLMGFALFGFGGCAQGMLGYLPLYLREVGWPGALADSALGTFHGISMIAVIPLALLSDRLGTRKKVLLAAALMMAIGTGLLSFADGILVWMAVAVAGIVRDGFMAVFMTTVIETEGIGPAYAGTGIGLVMVFNGLSSMVAPPIGNALAFAHPGLPFAFWAALALIGFGSLLNLRVRAGALRGGR